jgi:hypothetical protein
MSTTRTRRRETILKISKDDYEAKTRGRILSQCFDENDRFDFVYSNEPVKIPGQFPVFLYHFDEKKQQVRSSHQCVLVTSKQEFVSVAISENVFFLAGTSWRYSLVFEQGWGGKATVTEINPSNFAMLTCNTNVHAKGLERLRRGPGADFSIESKEGNEEAIKVHKSVMMLNWPFFEKMLNSGMQEAQENKLTLPLPRSTVEVIVRYLYGQRLKLEIEDAARLILYADMYLLPELKRICINHIKASHLNIPQAILVGEMGSMAPDVQIFASAVEHAESLAAKGHSNMIAGDELLGPTALTNNTSSRQEESLGGEIFKMTPAEYEASIRDRTIGQCHYGRKRFDFIKTDRPRYWRNPSKKRVYISHYDERLQQGHASLCSVFSTTFENHKFVAISENAFFIYDNNWEYSLRLSQGWKDSFIMTIDQDIWIQHTTWTTPYMEGLERLRNLPEADFQLQSEDGKKIKAHKTVLTANWPYFRKKLKSDTKVAQENTLLLPLPQSAVEVILRYLHGQELQMWCCIDDAVRLMSFSRNMLPELHDICIIIIEAHGLDIHQAIFVWQKSTLAGETEMVAYAEGVIKMLDTTSDRGLSKDEKQVVQKIRASAEKVKRRRTCSVVSYKE